MPRSRGWYPLRTRTWKCCCLAFGLASDQHAVTMARRRPGTQPDFAHFQYLTEEEFKVQTRSANERRTGLVHALRKAPASMTSRRELILADCRSSVTIRS